MDNGFARVRCGTCRGEFLVAYSCKGRCLCPSCAAKRAAALAAFLREEVLAEVGHAQWVFSIPKMLRPAVSLDRLHVGEDAGFLAYAARRRMVGRGGGDEGEWDPLDFLARIVMHTPEPRRHVIRSNGAYSSVVRARRARQAAAAGGSWAAPALPLPEHEPASLEWRPARRRWAQLIRRIYEVDPLLCPRCGGGMRIIAFITEPRVIGKILRHLQATGVDARSPPGADPSSPQRTVTAA